MPADVTINVTANTADAEQKLRKVGDQLKGAAQGGTAPTAAANPAVSPVTPPPTATSVVCLSQPAPTISAIRSAPISEGSL